MNRFPLIPVLVAVSAWASATPSIWTGPARELPPRVQVTVGDEVLELTIGGTPGQLADGRAISVAMLPTRKFSVEGAFEMEVPGEWRFSGSSDGSGPVDSWWTLGGDDVHLFLRRHVGKADEILEQYVGNSELTGGTNRRAISREIGGRELTGIALDKTVGGIRGGRTVHAVFEIYTWEQEGGVAWLLQIQRDTSAPTDFEEALRLVVVRPDELQVQPQPVVELIPKLEGADVLFHSWRWRDQL